MKLIDLIQDPGRTPFSFEVLPPLKGNGTEVLFKTIERLGAFAPRFVNITTHRSEYVYTDLPDGTIRRQRIRRRPGTIAVAAAIEKQFGLKVVPHLVASGNTREDLEYQLLDMQFLGITDVLVMRGDKAKDEPMFRPTGDGPAHATDLIEQLRRLNAGQFWDGTPIKRPGTPFHYGVACYPEKHEEAANPAADMERFKQKVELGAEYAFTQLFYDNAKYFDFVRRAREQGITVPIIPGLKPLTKLSQLSVVPKTFHVDLPDALWHEARKCTTDEQLQQVGIEWAVEQGRELLREGAPLLHFFTVSAVQSVEEIARRLF